MSNVSREIHINSINDVYLQISENGLTRRIDLNEYSGNKIFEVLYDEIFTIPKKFTFADFFKMLDNYETLKIASAVTDKKLKEVEDAWNEPFQNRLKLNHIEISQFFCTCECDGIKGADASVDVRGMGVPTNCLKKDAKLIRYDISNVNIGDLLHLPIKLGNAQFHHNVLDDHTIDDDVLGNKLKLIDFLQIHKHDTQPYAEWFESI